MVSGIDASRLLMDYARAAGPAEALVKLALDTPLARLTAHNFADNVPDASESMIHKNWEGCFRFESAHDPSGRLEYPQTGRYQSQAV